MDCFYIRGVASIVSQSLSKFPNGPGENVLANVLGRPYGVDQFLPGHKIAGMFSETHQHLHHFQFD